MRLNFSKSVLGFFLIAGLSATAQTQPPNNATVKNTERCLSSVRHHQLMQTDPQYAARMQDEESKIRQIINSGERTGSTYVIPVVVHVLNKGEAIGTGTNISDAQINSAIANLNACYGGTGSYPQDIGVQFQLAQRSPTCGSTTGIIRVNASAVSDYATNGITTANETTIKAISKWPNSEYYNIWIVSEIDGNNGGSGTQGYAYFPGASSAYDGAVILYNSFGYDPTGTLGYNLKNYTNWNVTANHELGHAFNLYHTFEGDDANSDGVADQCPVNVTCTSDGDKCCDTEAHNRNDGDCGSTGSTCTGQSLTNIVQNIMSYSSDACQVIFTADQKARIRAAISGTRASLLTSPALLPVTGSAPSVVKTCSPQSTNLSNNAGMGVFGLTIGGTSYASSGTVADGGFRNNWCGNFSLTAGTQYSITVTNATVNPEKVKVYIDYNNNGDFSDAGENVYTDNVGGSSHTGTFTAIASPVTGQPVWIRVISDFSNNTISGPCYAPQYGQVEDFSATFSSGCSVPSITGTTPGSRCGTGTVVLGATASAGTLNWYAASTGGSSLGTGTSFTTPSISTTTTYYVDATNGGCTSARTAVIATVNTTPTVSGTTPGSRCGTGTVVLGATASAGTLNWYAASTGGSSLGTGTSYTTPSISTTTTYYVDATNGGCTSARTAVIATVNTTPTVSGTTPGSRCGTGTVVLGATASAGTLNWYAASTGGSSLGTGTSYTTPSISTTTTYYVDATNGGCTSARTAVLATVNTAPTITSTVPAFRCGTGSVVLSATASAGTLNWYVASTGGSSLGTGTSYTTPSISATTTYYVDATNGGCTSARTAVAATINIVPTITGTTPGSRCDAGTVVLSATASAGLLNWYAASTGGSSLGNGTSYTTPSLSTTTTYYVDATNNGCTSARTAVIATVNTTPSVSTTTPGSRCGTGTVVLGATASAGTLNWYAASTGGSSLGTGTSYTTPSISTTTTYYVDATNGGCTSARTAVLATVNTAPTITSTVPAFRCGTGSVVLSATASAGTLNWYAASTGGSSLGTGISYTTPSLSTTTTYYVDATNGGCTSARTAVAATINIVPTITGTTPGSRCDTGTVVLSATASAGLLNWYAASTGGSSLGNGTSYTTPGISTTTTYYVDATNNGCTSARTAVIASVNTVPAITGTTPGSRCGTGTVVLGAAASAGTLNWYAASTGGSSLGTGASFTTPSISATVTYYVDATNGCTSARTAVIATVNPIPAISGTTPGSSCDSGTVVLGATASSGTLSWYAASTGGSSLGTGISFTTPSLSATTTYYVDATNGGCASARTAVIATITTTPTVSGTTPGNRCGAGTVVLGATASAGTLSWYAAGTGGSSLGTGTSFTTPSISSTTTYYVEAANGSCASARTGVIATINTCAGGPTTQLNATSCGATGLSISSNIYCIAVSGATDYEFTLTSASLGYSQSRIRATYSAIALNLFSGLTYSQTYDVTVKVKVGGVWGPSGPVCQITLMANPATQLSAGYCGATGLTLSSPIYCDVISGATDYEFTLSNSSLGYSQTIVRANYASANLNQFSGLLYGQTYNVAVRAKTGGIWSPPGAICQITLLSSNPTTQLTPASCGATNLTLTSFIYCNAVTGTTDYEFTLTNTSLGYSQARTRVTYAAIGLNFYTGLITGQTYNVTVRSKVNGIWSQSGPVCQITLAASGISTVEGYKLNDIADESTSSEFQPKMNAYPNPSGSEGFDISIEGMNGTAHDIGIQVFDLYGRLVWSELLLGKTDGQIVKINGDGTLAKGIYIVNADVDGTTIKQKVVIH